MDKANSIIAKRSFDSAWRSVHQIHMLIHQGNHTFAEPLVSLEE